MDDDLTYSYSPFHINCALLLNGFSSSGYLLVHELSFNTN
jgi:hypothetical protein